MKNLKEILYKKLLIKEKLIINKNTKINNYHYHPKDRKELQDLIEELMKERGDKADLNDIDTSSITNMYQLFLRSEFNGDISGWDVSNVDDMDSMFIYSNFNGDISKWDVSNVKNMGYMFYGSKFNGDISNWNVNKVKDMMDMFDGCPLKKNPPKWYKE